MEGVTSPASIKLEHLIARNVAELRREQGWTQPDLAWRMKAMGVPWTPNRITQIETLRRSISLLEVAALAWVYEVPIDRLLAGDENIEMPDETTIIPLAQIRSALTGDTSIQEHARAAAEVDRSDSEELRKIAKGLEIDPGALDWFAREVFGRRFTEERDMRLGNVSDLPQRSAQSKRGHVSRTLSAELLTRLDERGRDQMMKEYRKYRLAKHEALVARVLPGKSVADE